MPEPVKMFLRIIPRNSKRYILKKYKNPIARLTLSLEVFAYILPVVLLSYFIIIGGNFFPVLNIFIPGVVAGSLVTLIGASIIRWLLLRSTFNSLNSPGELNDAALRDIKLKLLLYPRYEAKSLFFRYTIGVGLATFLISLGTEMTMVRIIVIISGTLMVIPVNAIFFMFQSEISLSQYLEDGRLAEIIISKESYKPLTIFSKILISIISVLLPSLVIFATFMTLMNLKLMQFEYLAIHIIFVSFIMIITSISAAYFFAKSLKRTLAGIEQSLDNIAHGNLGTDFVPMITVDELGSMSGFMNRLLMKIREVISLILGMSGELTTAAGEMSVTAENFSRQSQTTAATVEEITSTLSEISAGGESIYSNIEYQYKRTLMLIDNIIKLNAIVNEEGNEMARAMTVKTELDVIIEEVREKINDTMHLMKAAADDAGRMLDYTGLINDISDRTNLLSLNASIEAARAGAYGKGFAVVADEIGKLAEQAGENTKSISEIVKTTNASMDKSFQAQNEAILKIEKIFEGLNSFGSVVDRIGELTRQDREINGVIKEDAEHFLKRADDIMKSMEEQKNAVTEIVKSISLINEASQSTAAASEELSASSESIAENAKKLKEEIEFFKLT